MLVNCLFCKKEFNGFPSRIKIGKEKYCSKICYNKATENNIKCICKYCGKHYLVWGSQKGKNYCSWNCYLEDLKDGKIKTKCLFCKKEMIISKVRIENSRGKYCSKDCFWASMKLPEEQLKQHQLENLHKQRFGGNREEVLERDDNKCTECGGTEKLVIHHIDGKGYKSVGFKNMNNKIENLITLCKTCHDKLHRGKNV